MSNIALEEKIRNLSADYIYQQAVGSLLLLLMSAMEDAEKGVTALPYEIPADVQEIKEEIKEELESLYNQILPEKLESADPRISTFWDQAILSTEDKIFPATNLRNYWQGRCPIQEIKAPHLPFYHYQSWNELWK